MIRTLHEGLLTDGFSVSLTKLCAWFDVPRRTVYYKPVKAPPKIDPAFEGPIKAIPLAAAARRLPGSGSRRTHPSAIARSPGCWASTRILCSGFSS